MLSDDELALIERRAAAATPGPWVAWTESRHGIGGESFIQIRPGAEGDDELYVRRFTAGQEVKSPNPELDADFDFIAAARQDVPRLIAEVKRLRAALDRRDSSN
ncbi:hypothetical protein ACIRST_32265 [Kitasatospora sp. NPDC101447]|uniref:hypothetical protein n=1 Tax=Kitasatospora sp. NPDC101447 TaxID=3364102 RepID=UPI00381B80E6